MRVKNNTIIYVARASNSKRDCGAWSLFLLAATVWSFAHMPLEISDHNKMVLWPGCGGHAEFSLHTKNVQSVWFVVKRRGCCCNLSGGVALIMWFTTNGMCVKNNTIIYVARACNNKRDCGTWSLLLLAATVRSFAHMPVEISHCNTSLQCKLLTFLILSCVHSVFSTWNYTLVFFVPHQFFTFGLCLFEHFQTTSSFFN